MTNDVQWEEITFDDIKIGDEIKRVNAFKDGTRAEVTGVVKRSRFGVLESEDNFSLVKRSYPDATTNELYRRKLTQGELDAKFEFPKGIGAVIEVSPKANDADQRFVHTGLVWLWTGTQYPASLSEDDIRRLYRKFVVISEGLKVDNA